MCFSPEADLVTGVFAGVVGVDALRHADRPRKLALAAMPAILGAHQVDESLVWWGLRGQLPAGVGRGAVYAFLAVAFALPFLVPVALLGVEPARVRRRWMDALLVAGAVTTALLLVQIARGPVGATVEGLHIAYATPGDGAEAALLGVLYVLATCGTLLVASSRLLAVFGLANLAAVIALSWLTLTGLTSLWCAVAAVTSVAIAVHLRRTAGRRTAAAVP